VLLFSLAAMIPWIRAGRCAPGLILVGIVVLLINLLAAGSLIYPGVAGTLWILVAVGASLTDPPRSVETHPPHLAYVVAALGMLAGLMCYLTAYWPVVASEKAFAAALRAQEQGDFATAKAQFRAAVEADPHSDQKAQRLAEFLYLALGPNPTPSDLAELAEVTELARSRSPLNSALLADQGRMYLALFQKTGQREFLTQAESLFRRAIEGYPTGIMQHAALAVTLNFQGQLAAAQSSANLALRLETVALQAGHPDKAIPAELRQQLLRIIESSN